VEVPCLTAKRIEGKIFSTKTQSDIPVHSGALKCTPGAGPFSDLKFPDNENNFIRRLPSFQRSCLIFYIYSSLKKAFYMLVLYDKVS